MKTFVGTVGGSECALLEEIIALFDTGNKIPVADIAHARVAVQNHMAILQGVVHLGLEDVKDAALFVDQDVAIDIIQDLRIHVPMIHQTNWPDSG